MSQTLKFRLPMVEGHAYITQTEGEAGYKYGVAETARFLQNACCGQDLQRVHFITYRICGMCPASHEEALFKSVENIEKVGLSDSSKALREIKRLLQTVKDSVFHYSHFAMPLFSADTKSFAEAKKSADLDLLATIYKKVNNFAKHGVDEIKLHLGGAALKRPDFLDEIDDVIEYAEKLVEVYSPPEPDGTEHLELDIPMATIWGDKVVIGRGNGEVKAIDFGDFMQRVGYTLENYALYQGRKLKTGPMARMYLLGDYEDHLSPQVRPLVQRFKDDVELKRSLNKFNPFDEHYLRLVEIVDYLYKVKDLRNQIATEKKEKIDTSNLNGAGYGYVEAPRGLLIYRTHFEKGIVHNVNITTPTAFFIPFINEVIKSARTEEEAVKVIVAGNPCNACFEER